MWLSSKDKEPSFSLLWPALLVPGWGSGTVSRDVDSSSGLLLRTQWLQFSLVFVWLWCDVKINKLYEVICLFQWLSIIIIQLIFIQKRSGSGQKIILAKLFFVLLVFKSETGEKTKQIRKWDDRNNFLASSQHNRCLLFAPRQTLSFSFGAPR